MVTASDSARRRTKGVAVTEAIQSRDGRRSAQQAERGALWISIWATVVIAVGALVLGVVTGTRIIVFDGAYMSIGLVLSVASLRAAAMVGAGPDRRYPFGRDALTPMVVTIQGLAIAGTLIYAVGDAIVLIGSGGSPVDPIVIAGYGAVTALAGFAVAILLRRRAPASDLVAAECAQWRAGAVLSAVMLIGAVIAAALVAAGLESVADYVDPVLVLVACVVLAYIPVQLIAAGVNELLEGAPSRDLTERIHEAVGVVRADFGLGEPLVRAGKVGRKLYVEVDFTVDGAAWDVAAEDEVRRAIERALSTLGMDVWAYVSLTADPSLYE
jgi:predicted Co/Zn/Cd cation transporter (cation efflux family)